MIVAFRVLPGASVGGQSGAGPVAGERSSCGGERRLSSKGGIADER
jgi:hypothetical protein